MPISFAHRLTQFARRSQLELGLDHVAVLVPRPGFWRCGCRHCHMLVQWAGTGETQAGRNLPGGVRSRTQATHARFVAAAAAATATDCACANAGRRREALQSDARSTKRSLLPLPLLILHVPPAG